MKKQLCFAVAALVLGVLTAVSAKAQESAIIQATASVISSMTVQGTNGLAFGAVTPGIPKAVDKTTAGSAGEWRVTGAPNAEVTLDFVLPLNLDHATLGSTMPISFSTTDAAYDDGTGGGQAAPAAQVDPSVQTTANIAGDGSLWVWIGGTVLPSVSETSGSYSGDITLTITYTGN
jgi:hypothetical protein